MTSGVMAGWCLPPAGTVQQLSGKQMNVMRSAAQSYDTSVKSANISMRFCGDFCVPSYMRKRLIDQVLL